MIAFPAYAALAALLLFPFAVSAAPFLTCDPYPPTGAQPTEFVVTISGVAQPVITPAVAVTGGKAMMLDLGPLNLNGERTFTARARNAYGQSAESQPLTTWVGPPSAPTNLRVISIE
jgi:uncharacterized RDD family membrane protein YckC